MKKSVLREYAKLIVRVGVNVQKGQEVMIHADLDQPEFVHMVVEEAYKAKAKKVIVEWNYQPLGKTHVRYQSVKTMGTVNKWQQERYQHMVDTKPCRIHLISEDPDGLKGMNMAKQAKAAKLRYPIITWISWMACSSGVSLLFPVKLGQRKYSPVCVPAWLWKSCGKQS